MITGSTSGFTPATMAQRPSSKKSLQAKNPIQAPLFSSSYREEEGESDKFWEAKPNRLVIGSMNKLAWSAAKLIGFDVYVDHKELNQLKKLIESDDGVILTPNHSHSLDSTTLSRALVSRGVPITMIGADVIFNRMMGINGKLLQYYGLMSVSRGSNDNSKTYEGVNDVLQNQKRALLVFPEGYVSHSNMRTQELKEGAAMFALHTVNNTDKNVKIVPISFYYDYENKSKMEQKITKTLDHLEKHLKEEEYEPGEVPFTNFSEDATLAEKTVHLLDYMVRSREQTYAERYGFEPTETDDPYVRLANLRQNTLQALYDKYEVELDSSRSEDQLAKKLQVAIKEYTAEDAPSGWRKTKQKVTRTLTLPIRLFKKQTKAEWAKDIKALKDISNLTMYPENYFDSTLLDTGNGETEEFVLINRLVEQIAILSRDLAGTYTPLFRDRKYLKAPTILTILRAFKQGDISVNVKIDLENMIDVRTVKNENADLDKKEMRKLITKQIKDRLDANLKRMEHQVLDPMQDVPFENILVDVDSTISDDALSENEDLDDPNIASL